VGRLPEVAGTIRALKERGVRVGIISNWDSRLRALLAALGLSGEFERIIVSCEVGAEKPSRAIFAEAVEAMGTRPDEAFHVGDDLVSDYEGARSAGLESALLVRRGDAPPGAGATVSTLDAILPLVLGGAA
jgi:putative hydrolase of the HAD superfamily